MEWWQWLICGWLILGVIAVCWMYIACENAPIIEVDEHGADYE